MDGVALEHIAAPPLAFDMPAEEQEQIGILLEGGVDSLPLRAEVGRIVAVDHPMAGDDGAAVRIGFEQAIGPSEHRLIACRLPGVVLQVEDDEIEAAGAEELVAVVIVSPVVAAIIVAPLEAVRAKVLIESGG